MSDRRGSLLIPAGNAEEYSVLTKNGILPMSDLEYRVDWERQEDYVVWIGLHYLGDEVVKEERHMLFLKPPLSVKLATAAQL